MSIEEVDASAGLGNFQKYDDVVITDRTLKTNYSTLGTFRAENSTLEGKIEARYGMILNQVVSFKEVNCLMGTVEAHHSRLEKVKARDGATLTETDAKYVEVSMGELTWTNSRTKTPVYSITARDGMNLKGVHCEGNTTCTMGEIKAQNSTFHNISARDGMVLVDSPAASCHVVMGSLNITAHGPALTYNKVSGRDGISLTNIQVKDSVETVFGNLYAKECLLPSILASEKIELIRTTADSACLHVSRSGVVILDDSTIEGDLVIEENNTGIIFRLLGSSGAIYINGQLYKPHQPSTPQQLNVEVRGGVIKGNIIFRNCQGTVKLSNGAQLVGQII